MAASTRSRSRAAPFASSLAEVWRTAPGTSVLAVTLGAFILVPPFVSMYNFCKRLNAAERLSGAPQGMEPGLLFVLFLFVSPVGLYIAQSSMNKVLTAQADAMPAMGAPASPEMPTAAPAGVASQA